jgi:hypothetical protein
MINCLLVLKNKKVGFHEIFECVDGKKIDVTYISQVQFTLLKSFLTTILNLQKIDYRLMQPRFYFNPSLFIRGLSGPRSVQTFAWKSGLKAPLLPLETFSPLQTILLSDLVRCDSPLEIIMAFCRLF